MALNCKLGELAVIVSRDDDNEGTVVRCMGKYVGPWMRSDGTVSVAEPGWWIGRPFRCRSTGMDIWCVRDRHLRPLRGGDGGDEVLQLAGPPGGAGAGSGLMRATTAGPVAPQASRRGPGWPVGAVVAHLKPHNAKLNGAEPSGGASV